MLTILLLSFWIPSSEAAPPSLVDLMAHQKVKDLITANEESYGIQTMDIPWSASTDIVQSFMGIDYLGQKYTNGYYFQLKFRRLEKAVSRSWSQKTPTHVPYTQNDRNEECSLLIHVESNGVDPIDVLAPVSEPKCVLGFSSFKEGMMEY